MSSVSLALPIAAVPVKPLENRFIKRVFDVLFEGPAILLAISASIVKKATEAYQKATNYVESGFKNFLKDPDKKKKTKVIIVENTEQAVRLRLKDEGRSADDWLVQEITKDMQNTLGACNDSGELIILNMGCIKQQYPGEQSQEDAIVLTTIHETVEKYGGFPETYGRNRIKWLDEGITEMIAREISFKLFPNAAGTEVKEYAEYNSLAKSICDVVGKTTVHSAFFQNSPAKIFDKLRKCGIPGKDISTLLKLGELLGASLDAADFDAKSNIQATKIFNTMLPLISKMKARTQGFDWANEPLETEIDEKNALNSIIERMNMHLKNIDSADAGMKSEARKCLLRLATDYVLVKYLGEEGRHHGELEGSLEYARHGRGTFQEQSIDLFAQAIDLLANAAKERAERSTVVKNYLPSELRLAQLLNDQLADGMAHETADEIVGKKEQQTYQPPFHFTLERISEKVGKDALVRGFFNGDMVPVIRRLGRQGKAAGFGTEIGDEQSFCAFPLLNDEIKTTLKKERNTFNLDGTWLKTRTAENCQNGSGLDFIFDVSRQYFPAMSIEERMQLSTSVYVYLARRNHGSSENDVYKVFSAVNAPGSKEGRVLTQVSLLSGLFEEYEKASRTKIDKESVGNLAWLASDMVYRQLMAAKINPNSYSSHFDLVQFVNGLEGDMKEKRVYGEYESLSESNWTTRDRLSVIKFYSYSIFSSDAVKAWKARIPDWKAAELEVGKIFPQASKDDISEFFKLANIYLHKNNYEPVVEPCRAVQLALSTKDALEGALLAAAMEDAGVSVPKEIITIEVPQYFSSIESRFRNAASNFDPSSLSQVSELVDKYLGQTTDVPKVPQYAYSLKNSVPFDAVIEGIGVAVMGMECTIGESSSFVPYLSSVQ